jgi:nitrite reductase/ring-hydroxylating ferredoxin subunit
VVTAEQRSIICRSDELADGGVGIGFTVFRNGEIIPAFIVRFNGRVHAYLNRCAHRRLKLNWNAGEFFDVSGGSSDMCHAWGALRAGERHVCGRTLWPGQPGKTRSDRIRG